MLHHHVIGNIRVSDEYAVFFVFLQKSPVFGKGDVLKFFRRETVLCQGDVVVEDGRITTLDTEEVLAGAEDAWRSLCLR